MRIEPFAKVRHLRPEHSITNEFVGLSTHNPVVIQTFPYSPGSERTPISEACALRQTGITARYLANLHVPPHDHEFYEITVVRDGVALHYTDWGDVEVSRGSVVVVPPRVVHAFADLQNLKVTNIYYQSEWLSEDLFVLLKQKGLVPIFLAADLFKNPLFNRVITFCIDDGTLHACVREMQDICTALMRETWHNLYIKACFLKFLILLSEAYCIHSESVPVLPFRSETWLVLEEMEDSLLSGKPFSFSQIAKHLGFSSRYLSSMFLKDVGLRPTSYFLRRRAHHAARLLLTPTMNLTDIAFQLNYANSAHFCNQFKQVYGISPSEYRRKYSTTYFRPQ